MGASALLMDENMEAREDFPSFSARRNQKSTLSSGAIFLDVLGTEVRSPSFVFGGTLNSGKYWVDR